MRVSPATGPSAVEWRVAEPRKGLDATGQIRACCVGVCPNALVQHLQRGHMRPALEPASFSLYDMRVVSEEQIQKWADEAEAGYDVDALKRRGRGRPGRGAEPMQVVAVRLTAEELEALDAAAAKNDMSRSEAIRAALARFAA